MAVETYKLIWQLHNLRACATRNQNKQVTNKRFVLTNTSKASELAHFQVSMVYTYTDKMERTICVHLPLKICCWQILMNGRNIDTIIKLSFFHYVINQKFCLRHVAWPTHLHRHMYITTLHKTSSSIQLTHRNIKQSCFYCHKILQHCKESA